MRFKLMNAIPPALGTTKVFFLGSYLGFALLFHHKLLL